MHFALKSYLSVIDTNNISLAFAYYLTNFRKKEMIQERSKMQGMLTKVENKHLDKQRILMIKF